MDSKMIVTTIISVIILLGCGYTINKENATAESRTAAFGLLTLVVGWYAPSPVTAMVKRQERQKELDKDPQES
jgi:hypothetical protein